MIKETKTFWQLSMDSVSHPLLLSSLFMTTFISTPNLMAIMVTRLYGNGHHNTCWMIVDEGTTPKKQQQKWPIEPRTTMGQQKWPTGPRSTMQQQKWPTGPHSTMQQQKRPTGPCSGNYDVITWSLLVQWGLAYVLSRTKSNMWHWSSSQHL